MDFSLFLSGFIARPLVTGNALIHIVELEPERRISCARHTTDMSSSVRVVDASETVIFDKLSIDEKLPITFPHNQTIVRKCNRQLCL